jgi:hypothetical protein
MKRAHVVVALAVLAVGLAGAVAVGRSDAKEEPDQPATAQAVAAATIRHVPAEAKLVKVVDAGSPEDMQVRLTYDVAGASVLLLIEIHSPDSWQAKGMGHCDQPLLSDQPDCRTQELKDGTKLSVVRQPDGTAALNLREDGLVVAHASLVGTADPVISTDVLQAIATDRMIGLTTSSRMLELGKAIELTSAGPG